MKKNLWKTVLTGLVAVTMLASLTACGQSSASSQPQSSGSESSSAPSSSASSEKEESPSSTPAESSAPASEQPSSSSEPAESSDPEAPASSSEPAPQTPAEPEGGKTLVVYFSASGNTKAVAEVITNTVDGDTFELVPTEPYTDADLDWTDQGSRVNAEHNDPSHRTALVEMPDLTGYDTVFIGYPLWWRQAPSIVWNFVENTDLSGKTIIPFCTSTSNGIGDSGTNLAAIAPGANWLAGERFGERLDENAVTQWVNSLGLTK